MTVTASGSIGRGELGLSALSISGSDGTYRFTPNGIGQPQTVPRTKYAAPSPWLHGRSPVSSVQDQTNLILEIEVKSTTYPLLRTAIADLKAALGQFAYLVTLTVGGVSEVWRCSPATVGVAGGALLHSRASEFSETLTVSIPVYPIPGS